MSDLRSAFRTLRKSPWLSLVIVLSLTLGIGANTVIFSWLRTVAFDPVPGVGREVLALEPRTPTGVYVGISWLEYRELRAALPSFAGLAVHRPTSLYLGSSVREERVWAELVSDDFFATLAVTPQLGRFFRADETTVPGGAPVVVISHAFWQRRFHGARDVIGRTLQLNHHTLTIVGVAPEKFQGGFAGIALDVWVPLTMTPVLLPALPDLNLRVRGYVMLAALRPGIARAQALGELAAAARRLAEEHPDTNRGIAYDLLPLWRAPRGGLLISSSVTGLQALGVLVLLVVCVNTANLLLARATVRQREIGIRRAVGAGAWRIVRLLLVESLLLAALGGGGGLVLALWGIDLVRQIPLPTTWPVHINPHLDAGSLLFAVALGGACGLAFGIAPAWQLAHADVIKSLRGGRGAIAGRSRLRSLLVGAEVAAALVLVVLSALFLKSFRHAITLDPGYDREKVLLATVDLAGRGYTRATSREFAQKLLARVRALPGVESAALATNVPLEIVGMPKTTAAIDDAPADPDQRAQTLYAFASADYFATMGQRLIAGHELAPLDDAGAPPDAVVSETFAAQHWPAASPLGRHVRVGGNNYQVVGVVRDAIYEHINERPQPMVWLGARAIALWAPVIHVRVRGGDPRAVLPEVRAAVRALDPDLAVFNALTLGQQIDNNLFMQRVPATILSVVGPLALALAGIGLYAVLAYALAQRTQEIGVRLTLGATPQSVVRLMVRQGMHAVLAGALAGAALAFTTGYFLERITVGVPLGDPVTYFGMPAALLGVALFACWLPARKAAQVDPMAALRTE